MKSPNLRGIFYLTVLLCSWFLLYWIWLSPAFEETQRSQNNAGNDQHERGTKAQDGVIEHADKGHDEEATSGDGEQDNCRHTRAVRFVEERQHQQPQSDGEGFDRPEQGPGLPESRQVAETQQQAVRADDDGRDGQRGQAHEDGCQCEAERHTEHFQRPGDGPHIPAVEQTSHEQDAASRQHGNAGDEEGAESAFDKAKESGDGKPKAEQNDHNRPQAPGFETQEQVSDQADDADDDQPDAENQGKKAISFHG